MPSALTASPRSQPTTVSLQGGCVKPPPAAQSPLRTSRRGFLAATAAATAASCARGAPSVSEPALEPLIHWEEEWARLLAESQVEGRLSLLTYRGRDIRAALEPFEKAFPHISLDVRAHSSPSMAIPRVVQEREADIYSYDVALFGIQSLFLLQEEGAFDPIRPAIFRPDVLNQSAWLGGFDAGFMDDDQVWVYNHLADVATHFWINTDLVKDGEIKRLRDLAEPNWKGRLLFADVRNPAMTVWMTAARGQYPDADSFLKKLLVDQQPAYARDPRYIAETLARGGCAVATGITRSVLQEFTDQGVGRNIKELPLRDVQSVNTTSGGLWLFNRAPHPGAARLFVNWALTKEGQQALSRGLKENSRRADVEPVDRSRLPDPRQTYFIAMREENVRKQQEARDLAKYLVG